MYDLDGVNQGVDEIINKSINVIIVHHSLFIAVSRL